MDREPSSGANGDYEITATMVIGGKKHTCTVRGNTDDLERLIAQMIAFTGVQLRLWSVDCFSEEKDSMRIGRT